MLKNLSTVLAAGAVVVIVGGIGLLVFQLPFVAAALFVVMTLVILALSLGSEGFWRATWKALWRLLTGW